MPNPYGAPEISVQDVHAKQEQGEQLILVDVREANELPLASFPEGSFLHVPLSEIAARRMEAIPPALQEAKDAQVVVVCHKGIRSAQVTMALRRAGWTQAVSMAGGIDAWAREIDPSVGVYAGV